MICPRCGAESARQDAHCHQCGFELALWNRLSTLQNDLNVALSGSNLIVQRLKSIQDSVASLRAELIVDFGTVSKQTAPPQAGPHGPAEPAIPLWSGLEPAPAQSRARAAAEEESSTKPVAFDFFENSDELKLGQRGLLVVGIVVVVLGVGYFLKYAFDQNWIGPAGRVALAYAGGIGGLILGEVFRRRGLATFGLYLCGGGIAVLYFSGYAAFQIYHLFDQQVAFSLMVAVTALAGFLALRHDVMWLAVLGIMGGFLTPVVLRSQEDHQVALMTYMTILNAGIVATAFYKRWSLLNGLGFAATWLLFLGWYSQHYSAGKFVPTIVFLHIFFVMYTLVPFGYFFLRSQAASAGFLLTLTNSSIAFGIAFVMVRELAGLQSVSWVSLSYAFFYLFLAWFLRNRNPAALEPLILLVALGGLFLVVTAPILLSGHWITVFWAAQGIAVVWIFTVTRHPRVLPAGIALLLISVAKYLTWDLGVKFRLDFARIEFDGGYTAAILGRWTTILSIIGALSGAATMLTRHLRHSDQANPVTATLRFLLPAVLACFVFIVLNVETAAFFAEFAAGARFAAISVLWATFAIVLMIVGFARQFAALRIASLMLFGATVAKVFFVDMSNVRTPYRIISFLVLGVMLIGASYLYHRFRNRMGDLSRV